MDYKSDIEDNEFDYDNPVIKNRGPLQVDNTKKQ